MLDSDYYDQQESIKDSYPKQKIRQPDFDGLFDMDDIDIENNEKSTGGGIFFEDEEQDVFPLKENNLFSNDIVSNPDTDTGNQVVSLSRASLGIKSTENNIRTRRAASSVVQNIPYSFQNKNRYNQQTPNSLPIKIPHFRSRMDDTDNDEEVSD